MKALRYLSVCSGIEAATVAWHPLGFVPVAFSEIESFPCAVLQHHYPHVPNLGDMTQFKQWPDYAIELLVGGTPCQSFSVAGLRKGLADPRGNLALVFLAIVDRYRPRWVVWENVPGVHSSWSDDQNRGATEAARKAGADFGRLLAEAGIADGPTDGLGEFEEVTQTSDFDCFLAGLEELGYGVASTVLDAQYFGVAQRRERVFVVGHIGGEWQRAAAVLFERAGLCGHPAPRRQTREGTTYSTSPSLTGSGRGTERTGESRGQDCVIPVSDVTATLTKNYATHHGRSAGNNGGVAENQLIPEIAAPLKAESPSRRNGGSEPIAGEFITEAIAFSAKDHGADAQTELSPTLRALNHDQSHANSGWSVAVAFKPAYYAEGRTRPSGEPNDVVGPLTAQTRQGDQSPVVATPIGIDGGQTGFALRSNASHSGDKGDGGVNTTLVAHALRADGFDASEDGTGRGTPLVPEIVGALSDGAHMGGGLNGQDAYSGRIIPALSGVGVAGAGQQGDGQRHERGAPDTDASRRFL